ncbi:MAG: thiamine-phosphate synthase family protein [Infirmifilum sp.]
MKLGKIPLRRLKEILEKAGVTVTLDSNPLDQDTVVSTNPAIGVPLRALGFFAFHYTATNIAVSHARPVYATLSILAPPDTGDEELEAILKSFLRECEKYGVRLVGGHTARYEGIEYPLAVSTILGKKTREREKPSPGDIIYLVGRVGAETAWLLGKEVPLEELSPLDEALRLQTVTSVKLMHDVSEGGILGALLEVSHQYHVKIKVTARSIETYPGFPEGYEPLASPTYGALIVFTSPAEPLEGYCDERGVTCTRLGLVEAPGVGVEYKAQLLTETPETPLVELYNPYTPGSWEPAQVLLAAKKFVSIPGVERIIPEVGTNIAYSKFKPERPEDVAAIEGRIVRTSRGARICGFPAYGASRHLARVIIEASKHDENLRSAINLKPEPRLIERLRLLGVDVREIKDFSSFCPVSEALARGSRGQAFYYRDLPNLEPSLVVLAENPHVLVETVRKALAEDLH